MIVGNGFVLQRFPVKQALHQTAFEQGFFHQMGHIVGGNLTVEDALGINHENRAHGAESAAAGLDNLNLVLQSLPHEFFLQHFVDTFRL